VQLLHKEKESLSEALKWGDSENEKGEVFTKPEIVRFMLITSGVQSSLLESNISILEPSCGQGEFVVEVAKLLVNKIQKTNIVLDLDYVMKLVKAFDISRKSIDIAKGSTKNILLAVFTENEAEKIVNSWFVNADFLLSEFNYSFSHIIGNPPYIRIENIPLSLLNTYRSRFFTMKDRADLYIAFYEKSLSLLSANGTLSFICSDRWTKNRYGSLLREYISSNFQLDLFVDLYGQSAFQTDVLTYPAITQISNRKQTITHIIHNPIIDDKLATSVRSTLLDSTRDFEGRVSRKDIVKSSLPWLFGAADELEMIKYIEENFPSIEDVGCKIYIGAATGNNKVYIVDDTVSIELDRKIPLVTARDLKNGMLTNSGKYIINTYDANGLIELDDYPMLKAYLTKNKSVLQKRHVAKQSPKNWYKTIDKVYPERASAKKLLIPDIKSKLTVCYDKGDFHPNNSLYYICSKEWDIRALQCVLLSGIGQLFVQLYSTKVAGGNLRYQTQHLRRIRLPLWGNISEKLQNELKKAGRSNDLVKAKELIVELYGLNEKQKQIIGC
jgi:methylase of polypeptide subunit release factors